MTDHPHTATERFLRHGVAGGYKKPDDWRSNLNVLLDYEGFFMTTEELSRLLLDPALWQAAGRSLGWSDEYLNGPYWLDYAEEAWNGSKDVNGESEPEWKYRQIGLIAWLWAHPGDVEGYLATLLDVKETE